MPRTSCDPKRARSDYHQRRTRRGKKGWKGKLNWIRSSLNNQILIDQSNYLSAECNRLWNIAMDMLPGVFPGRLLNICRDCCDNKDGWTVVVVVVGVTDPPTVNFAPFPSSFSSLAEESSMNDRSRLSGRPKTQRKRIRRQFTEQKFYILQHWVNVIVTEMAW